MPTFTIATHHRPHHPSTAIDGLGKSLIHASLKMDSNTVSMGLTLWQATVTACCHEQFESARHRLSLYLSASSHGYSSWGRNGPSSHMRKAPIVGVTGLQTNRIITSFHH